jgi:hypothetical protein
MLANLPINARECGADWLLKEYQNADIPFLRYPMHTVQGVTRTAHYTYNVGAQYNYVTEQPTVSFEEAPEVVTKALDLIKQNVAKLYPHARFNEVLNVGYFEAQKMGVSNLTTYFIFWVSIANTRVQFHQDGETGLGPTVASLSLGCAAKMNFRLKKPKGKKTKGESGNLLTLHLNHGDIMIMHGNDLQRIWEVNFTTPLHHQ